MKAELSDVNSLLSKINRAGYAIGYSYIAIEMVQKRRWFSLLSRLIASKEMIMHLC